MMKWELNDKLLFYYNFLTSFIPMKKKNSNSIENPKIDRSDIFDCCFTIRLFKQKLRRKGAETTYR